jgi:hypothetical protein
MRILLDQGTPLPLRIYLKGHTVVSAFERGWNTLGNGELLSAAEAGGFDLLIKTDQNLKYQQNLVERSIAIVVLMTTNWPRIEQGVPYVVEAVEKATVGAYEEIVFS